MIVERHVFGSVAGYRTLARSPGLSGQDCRFLETFSFGQPPSQAFVDSLARNPAYWVRPFGSRRALTRLVPGSPDEAGRSTVLMISAIVAATDWDVALRGDVDPLLRSAPLWQWDGAAQLAPINLPVTPPSKAVPGRGGASALLNLVSRIEGAGGGPLSIVVREEDLGPEDLRCLGMLIPPSARGQFSWACRSLSCRLGATVNCVAAGVTIDAGANVVRPDEHVAPSVYAQVLDEAGLRGKGVDTAFIATYSGFGRHGERTTGDPSQQPVIVVESPAEGSWMARYGGWALSAVLAVAVIVLTALLLLRSPAEANDQPEGDGNRRTVAVVPAEPTLPAGVSSAVRRLVAATPLPREKRRREEVLKALESLVSVTERQAPGTSRPADVMRPLRDRHKQMSEFEKSLEDISSNGVKTPGEEIKSDYPWEVDFLTRRDEVRRRLGRQLKELTDPERPKPITSKAIAELENMLARYEYGLNGKGDATLRDCRVQVNNYRKMLGDSQAVLEAELLNLLNAMIERKPLSEQTKVKDAVKTAMSNLRDSETLRQIGERMPIVANEWNSLSTKAAETKLLTGKIDGELVPLLQRAWDDLCKDPDDLCKEHGPNVSVPDSEKKRIEELMRKNAVLTAADVETVQKIRRGDRRQLAKELAEAIESRGKSPTNK